MCATFLGFALLICLPAALRGQDSVPPCDSPQLEGGTFVIKEYTDSPEQKLFYTCNDGWKLTVDGWWGTASCQNNTWIPTPQCIDENACIAPEVPNAKYRESPNGSYEDGHIMRITCVTGYKLKNNLATTSCVKGNWTTMPVCESAFTPGGVEEDIGPYLSIDKCGPQPRVENGDVVEESLTYLKYQCSAYYTLQGSDTVVCHSNGTWSNPPTCLDNFCTVDTATYEHLENIGTQFVKSGDRQKFQCTTSSREISYVYCEDGQFTLTRCCSYMFHGMKLCP